MQARTVVVAVVLFTAAQPAVLGQATDGHRIFPADAIQWGPAPASLPQGAQAVVLYGDPGKEGQFALRLKLPAGYHIPPHVHPKEEIVTVLSGNFRLGMGEKAERGKAQSLRAGSFFAFAPGMAHFAYTEGETVVQLNSNGPWGITYVNPADDPRKK
jgi:quercetin dioxygenase-like cupin family protein